MNKVKIVFNDAFYLQLVKELLVFECTKTEASYTGKSKSLTDVIRLLKDSLEGKRIRNEKSLKKVKEHIGECFSDRYKILLLEVLEEKEFDSCYPDASTFTRFAKTASPKEWTIDAVCVSLGYAGFEGFKQRKSLTNVFQLSNSIDKKRFYKILIAPTTTSIDFITSRKQEFEEIPEEELEGEIATVEQEDTSEEDIAPEKIPSKNQEVPSEKTKPVTSKFSKNSYNIKSLLVFFFLGIAVLAAVLHFTNILRIENYFNKQKVVLKKEKDSIFVQDSIKEVKDFSLKKEEKVISPVKKASIQPENKRAKKTTVKTTNYRKLGEFINVEGKKGYIVIENEKLGIIDANEKMILPIEYDEIELFKNGLAKVRKKYECSLINYKGKNQFSFIGKHKSLDVLFSKKYTLTSVKKNNKKGLVNKNNEIIVPAIYDEIFYYGEKLIRVIKGTKTGFINVRGEVVIPIIYDDAANYFSEEMAFVTKNNKSGYINDKGEVIISLKFDKAQNFIEDKARVTKNGTIFYINKEGECVQNCPEIDTDKDGVPDKVDKCPLIKGLKSNDGCPKKGLFYSLFGKDTDGDGVKDKEDACPKTPGLKEFNGCPDRDGDGIADMHDACPDNAGPAKLNGCPDTDGDGIPDNKDKCPNTKGQKLHYGCPDTDGDGVIDSKDNCKTIAGPKANNGCPWKDTDGDGVLDKDDKCPKTKGSPSNNGCPDKQ